MEQSHALAHGIAWGPVALGTAAAVTAYAATAALAAPPPKTALRVFKPVADTYVTSARPRSNFGRAAVLRVDGAPEATAYVRFGLRRLRGEITSVTLLLHPRTAGRATYAVRRVMEDDWRERQLTYMNAPRISLRYTASKPVRRGAWSAVDVTSFVDYGDDDEVSLAITTRGTRQLAFGSRESRSGPRLVVRFEDERGKEERERVLDALRRR